ncbi:thermonuclease family protein [Paenibacillus yanchengensis]|uniref:Thermonuclease family protein n=1 Tax=Paenibacillus yanchengensis TaxID=2035833 RepID=A0ABW4YN83_9BACL
MNSIVKLLCLLLLFSIVVACSASTNSNKHIPKESQWLTVANYINGEIIEISVDKQIKQVKLLSLQLPEHLALGARGEEYSAAATKLIKTELQSSEQVKLTFDEQPMNSDGVLEAIVELKNGKILNELLLIQGLAKVHIEEPNVKMENKYKKLEQSAKQLQRGIWETELDHLVDAIPLKKIVDSRFELEVDKQKQTVYISNTSSHDIDLDGWKLVSVKDNQTYTFHEYTLPAHSTVQLISGKEAIKNSLPNVIVWEADHIWHLSDADPAELYTHNNELVSVWEDQ